MPTLEKFIQRLAKSGVLSVEELNGFLESLRLQANSQDAVALARRLTHAGKLTPLQASLLLEGKGWMLRCGAYLLTDRLGGGGMGEVFKARHVTLGRLAAIKVLPPDSAPSADALSRFQQEVRLAAQVNHPHLVSAFDAGHVRGWPYMVMEYVEGQDLSSRLRERGPLDVPLAATCLEHAALGLEYAHRKGLVHRDVKPANLILDARGVVRVLDLGLARSRLAANPAAGELTESGQLIGTYDYMSPEQAEDPRLADARSDIYSLGCTLHRLLTGRPPYERPTVMKTLLAHREDPIPALSASRSDAPPALEAIYQKMLAKSPNDRFQSLTEVLEALHAWRG